MHLQRATTAALLLVRVEALPLVRTCQAAALVLCPPVCGRSRRLQVPLRGLRPHLAMELRRDWTRCSLQCDPVRACAPCVTVAVCCMTDTCMRDADRLLQRTSRPCKISSISLVSACCCIRSISKRWFSSRSALKAVQVLAGRTSLSTMWWCVMTSLVSHTACGAAMVEALADHYKDLEAEVQMLQTELQA